MKPLLEYEQSLAEAAYRNRMINTPFTIDHNRHLTMHVQNAPGYAAELQLNGMFLHTKTSSGITHVITHVKVDRLMPKEEVS